MTTRLMFRTERLVAIEQLLFHSQSGMRAVELAEACGVDRRTVYRDLSLLNEIGVPVYQKTGRFHLNRKHYLANIRLNLDELLALVLAVSALSRHSISPHLLSAMQKLSQTLPLSIRTHANSLIDSALRQQMDAAEVENLELITRAWGDLMQTRLWYASRDGTKIRRRDVLTYGMEMRASGSLYVIGYDSLSQRVRSFQLSRIRRVQILNNRYELPAQYAQQRQELLRERNADTAARKVR